jgi:hypothetical protein
MGGRGGGGWQSVSRSAKRVASATASAASAAAEVGKQVRDNEETQEGVIGQGACLKGADAVASKVASAPASAASAAAEVGKQLNLIGWEPGRVRGQN